MVSEPMLNAVLSPKKSARIRAAAPLTQECAEGYSGNGGVTINGVQFGSGVVAGLPSVSASGMAVTGRHESNQYFASQQPITESARARFSDASKRAFSIRVK